MHLTALRVYAHIDHTMTAAAAAAELQLLLVLLQPQAQLRPALHMSTAERCLSNYPVAVMAVGTNLHLCTSLLGLIPSFPCWMPETENCTHPFLL